MGKDVAIDLNNALAQIPGGLFVLTSNFEGRQSAVLVKWVQPCSTTPPMVMVALATGQTVEPIIRDSRFFTLSQISAEDRFLLRKFNCQPGYSNGTGTPRRDPAEDPLLSLMTLAAPSGCPILERALSYLDCEVVRHIELDADHRIYVGQIHRGGVLHPGTPAIRYGDTNGDGGNVINGGNGSNGAHNAPNAVSGNTPAAIQREHTPSERPSAAPSADDPHRRHHDVSN